MTEWLGIFEGSGAGFRFPIGTGIEIQQSPTLSGIPARVRFSTRYAQIGDENPYPVALRASVDGPAESIEDVMHRFWHASVVLLPPISVAANGDIPEMNPVAIVELGDNPENEFLHRVRPHDSIVLRQMKVAPDGENLLEVLNATFSLPNSDWVHRATLQYSGAIGYWRPGQELMAVQHLFMAAEVLSRLVVERHMSLVGGSRKQLARAWDVKQGELEQVVRGAIFVDPVLAEEIEAISNGLEHGYDSLPRLQAAAAAVRDPACKRVREALLGFFDIPHVVREALLDEKHERPARTDPLRVGLAGKILGSTIGMRDGGEIPFFSPDDVEMNFRENADGGYRLRLTSRDTVGTLPAGLSLRVERSAFGGPISSIGEVSVE